MVTGRELAEGARVVALPLRTRFRGLTVRETALLRGPDGWAEFAAFPEYGDDEAASWLAAAVEWGWAGVAPMTAGEGIAAEEEARARVVPVNATVPAVGPADVPVILRRFPGAGTAKVKVAERGQTLDDDVARVAAVRAVLGPSGAIRVDANGGWSVAEAERAAHALAAAAGGADRLDYLEQPCATVPELASLRSRLAGSGLRVAADESVRRATDPLAVARAGAADVLVVKAAPLGGVRRALALVAEAGLPAVVSSALESSVGLAAGAALAARLGELSGAPAPAGLGTAALFAADVTARPLLPVDGALPVRRVAPDTDLLDRWTAAPDRVRWWRARIARCAERIAL